MLFIFLVVCIVFLFYYVFLLCLVAYVVCGLCRMLSVDCAVCCLCLVPYVVCVLCRMLSVDCAFLIASSVFSHLYLPKTKEQLMVRKDMDVNEHQKPYNSTLAHILKAKEQGFYGCISQLSTTDPTEGLEKNIFMCMCSVITCLQGLHVNV
jgi:hypothetical protein